MSEGLASVTVDVRGLNCPIPLLKTRKAMAVAAVGRGTPDRAPRAGPRAYPLR